MQSIHRVVLIANGDLSHSDYIRSHLRPDDFVVVANGGTRIAHVLGVIPNLLIGDSDSLELHLKIWLQTHNVPYQAHPADKDATDLELAVQYALTLKPQELLFIGLTGRRTDQMMGNFALLVQVAGKVGRVSVIAATEQIYLVQNQLEIRGIAGQTVSILAWGGAAEGITTQGLKWELQNATLAFGATQGISNIMTTGVTTITLQRGLLLVIHQEGDVV